MALDDVSKLGKRGKTAIVDGKELDADKVAQIHEVREVFQKLQKAMKQIALYRHNTERYAEYLKDTYEALNDYTNRHGSMSLKVAATAYIFSGVEVFTDESRDNNLCYPFYAHGIRMLIFNSGITSDELLRFLSLVMSSTDPNHRTSEDFITRLWKAELNNIQYVVVEGFKVIEDESADQVQMEVDQVVAYLYRQLQGNSDDIVRFARVSSDDLERKLDNVDQVRGAVITGETATAMDRERVQRQLVDEESTKLLPKMVLILFQVLELVTTEENTEDVSEAFSQMLDAMLMSERFDVISQILDRFQRSLQKKHPAEVKARIQACRDRFILRMGEPQRINNIAQVFNQGTIKDPAGVRSYMMQLTAEALPPLLDALERVDVPNNRRLMCDVLVEIAKDNPKAVAQRLHHPSSNVVKDMLYILDHIDPPGKLDMIAALLEHNNVVLRLETLNTLGRNPCDETWPHILKCLKGTDAQMRTAAVRVLHFFEPERSAREALRIATAEDFHKKDRLEQKTVMGALAQINHPKCQAHVQAVLAAKGSLFSRGKVEEQKLLLVEGLADYPAIPTFQMLAAISQDTNHSKEVQAAARNAALEMKGKILGGRPAQG
jgi:HEAT repeat protein